MPFFVKTSQSKATGETRCSGCRQQLASFCLRQLQCFSHALTLGVVTPRKRLFSDCCQHPQSCESSCFEVVHTLDHLTDSCNTSCMAQRAREINTFMVAGSPFDARSVASRAEPSCRKQLAASFCWPKAQSRIDYTAVWSLASGCGAKDRSTGSDRKTDWRTWSYLARDFGRGSRTCSSCMKAVKVEIRSKGYAVTTLSTNLTEDGATFLDLVDRRGNTLLRGHENHGFGAMAEIGCSI